MIDLATFVVFKPVSGGYVYKPASAWGFGSRKHYLVTGEQKTALLALYSASTRPVSWTVRISLMTLPSVLATALSLWARRFGYNGTSPLGLIVMIAMLASIYPAIVAGRAVLLQRLRPILATLPPTNERITASEVRQALIEAAEARAPAAISPTRLMIVKVASLVSIAATLGGMISQAIDVYGVDHLNFVTLYLANANLAGAAYTILILSMGFLFAVFGRNSPRA